MRREFSSSEWLDNERTGGRQTQLLQRLHIALVVSFVWEVCAKLKVCTVLTLDVRQHIVVDLADFVGCEHLDNYIALACLCSHSQ